MSTNWQSDSKLVMFNLEDHETRIAKLEVALVDMRIEAVRMTMKYSFLGSITGTLVTIVPVLMVWYFHK